MLGSILPGIAGLILLIVPFIDFINERQKKEDEALEAITNTGNAVTEFLTDSLSQGRRAITAAITSLPVVTSVLSDTFTQAENAV